MDYVSREPLFTRDRIVGTATLAFALDSLIGPLVTDGHTTIHETLGLPPTLDALGLLCERMIVVAGAAYFWLYKPSQRKPYKDGLE